MNQPNNVSSSLSNNLISCSNFNRIKSNKSGISTEKSKIIISYNLQGGGVGCFFYVYFSYASYTYTYSSFQLFSIIIIIIIHYY